MIKTWKEKRAVRSVALLLFVALLGIGSAWAQPGPGDKVDSLRWAAMQWEQEGLSGIANWKDSLYICLTGEEDDGSGAVVDPGESEGISVTNGTPDLTTFVLDQGFTFVWEGKDDANATPYDVGIVDFTDELDPEDGVGEGIGVGVHFPELGDDSIQIIVYNGDETAVDTVIVDPGPDPSPPGPFPFPNPPTIAWIDSAEGLGQLCDLHDLMLAGDGSFGGAGPRRAGQPAVGYELTLAISVPFKVRGSSKTVMGDRLLIIPQNTSKVPKYITTLHAIPRHMMEGVLVDASVRKFGLEHHGLGNPLLTLDPGTMTVSNIGSSGEDGVSTDLPDGTEDFFMDIAPLDLGNGDVLEWGLAGTVDAFRCDSLWRWIIEGVGDRTFFTIDAGPDTGWDTFTLQMVSNGQVLKELSVADGFRFGMKGITLEGFGRATQAGQGWDGFMAAIQRNGRSGQLRIIPDATNLARTTLSESRFMLAAIQPGFTLDIEGITVGTTAAPSMQRVAQVKSVVVAPVEKPRLLGNYPEPFSPVTSIRYELPEAAEVRLEVFDLMGRRVAVLVDGRQEQGRYTARFDGANLASGLYVYRLTVGAAMQSRTMLLTK